jgi:spore coat polysaccharide biosynthesis predicted glycosyltransferase SpsG
LTSGAIFRADGSNTLGLGHVMRLVAFAHSFADRGIRPVFIYREDPAPIEAMIHKAGFAAKALPASLHGDAELRFTEDQARQAGARVVVTDVSHKWSLQDPDSLRRYHRWLSDRFFTICLAGNKIVDFPAQVVISPYAGLEKMDRTALPKGTVQLLGPQYQILRPEFIAAARTPRPISPDGRKLLICLGGGDDLNFTEKSVRALLSLKRSDIELDLFLGPAYSGKFRGGLQASLDRLPGAYRLHPPTDNVAEAMMGCDLAVINDGVTKYEAAATGTPAVMLSRFDSEKVLNQEFERAGSVLHAGDGSDVSVENLSVLIQDLLANDQQRRRMSEAGRRLVDGHGNERILEMIPKEVLR